jgi:arsenite-transporting ATPase
VINGSVAATKVSSPLLRQRASNELREINAVAAGHAKHYAVVPLLEEEPIGTERLKQLAAGKTGQADSMIATEG